MKRLYTISILALFISSLFIVFPAQAQENRPCEQCGMTMDAIGQARFNIVDVNNTRHYACCPMCVLKLIKTYGQLIITTFCDYNGPSYPITINAKSNGTDLTVNPTTALIIQGGSCMKNRIVYDTAAADALLRSPNNGTSQWLSPLVNVTVPANSTRLGIPQALQQNSGGASSSVCEQCGMNVDEDGKKHLKIFNAAGTRLVACCPVCALKLLKTHGEINITSYCDYYGPSYPITIHAKDYGSEVSVTPSDALIILGGGCTKNRIVYNSSAADALLAPPNNGTSQWLSKLTNATVLPNATRIGIVQAAFQYGGGIPSPSQSPIESATPMVANLLALDTSSFAIIVGVTVAAIMVAALAMFLRKRK